MSDIFKTVVLLGVAVALTALAVSMKPGEVANALYDDEGELFFPEFTDSASINELEVRAFREATSDVYVFAVRRDDKGVWRIPSHENYAADANDQMGKAAAMLIGLKKGGIVGDEKGDHAKYSLVDPLAEGVETEGRGKRITLKDKAGNVLADLIVGDEVEGKAGTFFCRLPEGNDVSGKRVYKAKLEGALSTQFTDWIETDLLQAKTWNIDKIVFDNYSVDEQRGAIVPGDKLVLAKGEDNQFALDGLDAASEQTDTEKVTDISNTLGQIKIVGVRPKPEGLTARLERANGIEARVLQQQLQQKGYFLARGKMVSNEGDLIFEMKSGVRYTLRFGELVYGEGDELTAGIGNADAEQAGDKGDEAVAANRYLMVTAEFVPELLEKPAQPRMDTAELDKRRVARTSIEAIVKAVEAFKLMNEGALPGSLDALLAPPAAGEEPYIGSIAPDPWGNAYVYTVKESSFSVVSNGRDGAIGGTAEDADVRSDAIDAEDQLDEGAQAWAGYDAQVAAGQEEADKLTKRFGRWYYVIDKALFEKLKPQRADLVKAKEADAAAAGPDGGK